MDENNSEHREDLQDEIDVRVLFALFWNQKIAIVLSAFIFTLLFSLYSLTINNQYTSHVLLAPSNNDISSESSTRSGFAGLLQAQTTSPNTLEAIETLPSFKFFKNSILNNINLENLMALSDWDPVSNEISYNEDIFNKSKNVWIEGTPSLQKAHKKFITQHMSIDQDEKTGFIDIYIVHESPYIAKKWLDIIVININSVFRDDHKKTTTESINFLNKQIANTNFAEVKQALSSILKQEAEKLMLIESSDSYIFKTIDPPYVPETRSSPNRTLIALLGLIFGFIAGITYSIYKFFKRIR